MAAPADQRLQQLEGVEREISQALQSAGQALSELARDKPTNKQLEAHTTQFLKTLENVESQPHEGSSYAAQKNLQMAFHRIEHIRSRVNELDRLKNTQIQARQQASPRSGLPTTDTQMQQQQQQQQQQPAQQQQQQQQPQQQRGYPGADMANSQR